VALTTLAAPVGTLAAPKGRPGPAGPAATTLVVYPPQRQSEMYCPNLVDCHPLWTRTWLVLSARLTTSDGRPVEGRMVTLQADGAPPCEEPTNSYGVASCWSSAPAVLVLTGHFAGDAAYLPSSGEWHQV
jgi:hypothetical protein